MRQFLIDFLKALEAAVPPPPKCHHTIGYAQYGSDVVDGWKDQLAFTLTTPPAGAFSASFSTMAISQARSRMIEEILTLLRRPVRKRKISTLLAAQNDRQLPRPRRSSKESATSHWSVRTFRRCGAAADRTFVAI